MTSAEERIKILKMVEEGKITAEEGARLLKALSKSERKARRETPRRGAGRWLRIRVSDLESGEPSVNINLPMKLLDVGLRIGARFAPDMDGLELEALAQALREGMEGKIIDVIDEEEGQRVEIYVE